MLNSVNGIELIQAEIVLEFKGDFKIKTCRCGRTSVSLTQTKQTTTLSEKPPRRA